MLLVLSRLSAVDVLEAVANHGDLAPLVEHLNAGGANTVRVGGVDASVADTSDFFMHRADEPSTLTALNPVGLSTGRLGGVAIWWREYHGEGFMAAACH
jgi:hypothetical protein